MDTRLNEEIRRRCLSATDIVKIRGHYGCPLQVWAAKQNPPIKVEPDNFSRQRMLWGSLMEAPVWLWYCAERGIDPDIAWSPNTLPHSNNWLCATPDYIIPIKDNRWRIIEVKTTSTRLTAPSLAWIDQVTVQWEVVRDFLKTNDLGELDKTSHVVACHMQWGPEGRIWEVPYDPVHTIQVLEQAQRWWEHHIRDREKPPAGGSRTDTDVLGLMYPCGDNGTYHVAPEWALEAHQRDTELKLKIDTLMTEQREIRNRIKDSLGECEGYILEGGERKVIWSWRNQSNGRRVLRRHRT